MPHADLQPSGATGTRPSGENGFLIPEADAIGLGDPAGALQQRTEEGGDQSAPAHAIQGRKVAMVVFNSCHADARVLRQAATLTEEGADVRIFAIGNGAYPPGLETLANGVQIERIAVRSAFNLAFVWLAAAYHLLRRTESLRRIRDSRRGDPVGDLRTRRERREALQRMRVHKRLARSVRLRITAAGMRYRSTLRTTYLWFHGRLGKGLRPIHRPTQQLNFWTHVRLAIEAWSPDAVHAHDANTLIPSGLASTTLNVPLVYDSHELWRHRNRGGRRAPIGRVVDAMIETWGVRRAEAVITVSPGLVRWLEAKYGLGGRVHLLRNTPSRIPAVAAPSLRELVQLSWNERIVLYTGRITTGRGIEEAIDAIKEMPSDVHLVMLGYGDPGYVRELHEHAARQGVSHRFRHAGSVPHEQVSATASQADVAVVAVQPTCLSYLHCLPNKLFEAIQAGLPVVASRLPDIDDLMREHQIGETFTVGDAVDMRRALTLALQDPEALKRNVQRAADVLCWEVERDHLISIYAGVLRDRSSGALNDEWDDLFSRFSHRIDVPSE